MVSPEALASIMPVCSARAAGRICALCGMTTAFIRIGAGDREGALAAHAASIALWALFVVNFIAAAAYCTVALLRRQRRIGGR
jgi:hypothetical protein